MVTSVGYDAHWKLFDQLGTYLRADCLAMVSITAEEINTLFIYAVSCNDSAIDMDWKANIRAANVHREDINSPPHRIVTFAFV
jgi:hypothetical protein